MEKKTQEINLSVVARAIVHRAWIIVLAVALCGAGMLVYAKNFVKPTYRASVQLYVNNTSQLSVESQFISYSELTAAQDLVRTYVTILQTYDTLKLVVEHSGLNYSYEQMQKMVSAEAVNETEVFEVSVVAPTPQDAQTLANSIADVLPERISSIVNGSSVCVIQRAILPQAKYAPDITAYTMLGALVGLCASVMIIVIIELADNRIHDEKYASETYGIRTLASIPNTSKSVGKVAKGSIDSVEAERARMCENLSFSAAEAYKRLRTNLFSTAEGKGVLGITSSDPCDGKSTIAVNLAYMLAKSGKKTLLVEADLRKPVLAARLGISAGRGLSDLLLGKEGDFVQDTTQHESLKVLCAGKSVSNPAELLGSDKMFDMLEQVRAEYDYVIVDLPPINQVADAITVSSALDGVLLAVRQRKTTKMSLENAMEQVAYLNSPVLGFVVTDTASVGKYGKYGKYEKQNLEYYQRHIEK